MSEDNERRERDRPRLRTRVGRGLSFMNKLALALLVAGLVAVLLKHH
jgi:hypothetical protein